jgi:nucleoside-diphosphate-sugar epimerase
MSYFVLGSSSYLGTNLISYLQKKMLPVVGISRNISKNITCEQLILNESFNMTKLNNPIHENYVINCLNSYYKNPTSAQTKEMTEINFDLPKKFIEEISNNQLNLKFINFASYFNFIDPPAESVDYQVSKKSLTDFIKKNKLNQNIKEVIISDVFGESDIRNKIFNIILKNKLEKKEITFSNPDNFVNLIYVEKLIKFIFQFIHEDKTTAVFLNKYSIQVGLLDKLVENILRHNEVALKDYFITENRFDNSEDNYGETILTDLTNAIYNESYRNQLLLGGRSD